MGPLGVSEILILLVVALLLFGPRKLPELGRVVGRGLAEFRKASNDLRNTIEQEVRTYENTIEPPSVSSPPESAAGDSVTSKTKAKSPGSGTAA